MNRSEAAERLRIGVPWLADTNIDEVLAALGPFPVTIDPDPTPEPPHNVIVRDCAGDLWQWESGGPRGIPGWRRVGVGRDRVKWDVVAGLAPLTMYPPGGDR